MSFSTSCCAGDSRVHSAVFVGRAGVDTQRDVFHLTVIRVREASQFFLTAHFPLLRNHSRFTRRIGPPNKRANRKLRK